MRVIIVGGGIGGLALGVALTRAGIEFNIYERASEIREVGAGLMVATNAVRVLDRWGVAAGLLAKCPHLKAALISKADGTTLVTVPAAQIARRLGQPTVCMHRHTLLESLLRELPPARVHAGFECTGLDTNEKGVTAEFANGHRARGDLLVGADDIRSSVRTGIGLGGPLRFAGYGVWRAIVDDPEEIVPAGEAAEYWGNGTRFGCVQIEDHKVYWYATENCAENDAPAADQKGYIAKCFSGYNHRVRTLMKNTPAEAILHNLCYDIAPMERWSQGRVTLLGDAAHATTPNLGQGACQAIEDAFVLANLLKSRPNLDEALAQYESARKPRTRYIQEQSRRLGAMGQWEDPLVCKVRDWIVQHTPASVYDKQYAKLFNFPPDSSD